MTNEQLARASNLATEAIRNASRDFSAASTFQAAIEELRALQAAIERSGFDLSPCGDCGETVVCRPGVQTFCRKCSVEEPCAAEEMASQ